MRKSTWRTHEPSYVTEHFAAIIQELGLRKIRFHDLRHSCASELLAQGVPMKQIQEWLGHSDMSTTANIYSHLDAVTKADTGAAMSKALG
jgi:integrase